MSISNPSSLVSGVGVSTITADTNRLLSTSETVREGLNTAMGGPPSEKSMVKLTPNSGPLRSTIGGSFTSSKVTKVVAMVSASPSEMAKSTCLGCGDGLLRSLL